MTLTVQSKRFPDAQPGGEDDQGRRTYTEVFEVDQTDGGALASGVAVAIAAQALMTGDPVPLRGDNYSYGGTTDLDSYAQGFSWERPNPLELPTRWHIKVHYQPASGVNPGQLSETNPLLWPTEYWLEWAEESVVLDRARNVDALLPIFRPADTSGPVVNAAGCEFTDAAMTTRYYPILNCQKAYETLDEIVALNVAYQRTTNDDTFFGSAARTAKYLLTEAGRIQRTQGVSFYMGITRIWFKSQTWDREILNIGWNCLVKKDFGGGTGVKYIGIDDGPADGDGNVFHGAPDLFAIYVGGNRRASNPAADDEVRPSEPMNLNLDGTRRTTNDGVFLTYRELDEVDYSGIGIGG